MNELLSKPVEIGMLQDVLAKWLSVPAARSRRRLR